jgi:hypothetical protein
MKKGHQKMILIYSTIFLIGAFLGALSLSNGSGYDPLKNLWIQSALLTLSLVFFQLVGWAFSIIEFLPPPPEWAQVFGTFWGAYLLSGFINHMLVKKKWNS